MRAPAQPRRTAPVSDRPSKLLYIQKGDIHRLSVARRGGLGGILLSRREVNSRVVALFYLKVFSLLWCVEASRRIMGFLGEMCDSGG